MTLIFRLLLLVYLGVIVYFAGRSFVPIPGILSEPGTVYEDRAGARTVFDAVTESGELKLEMVLRTGSLEQLGPARVVSLSANTWLRNFSVGQSEADFVFRMSTMFEGDHEHVVEFVAEDVFRMDRDQHFDLTYDDEALRFWVDGELRAEQAAEGDFSVWLKRYLLVMGDEVVGGRRWDGEIRRLAIYAGVDAVDPIYVFPGSETVKPLRYRNLFFVADPEFNLWDCTLNIAGFVPLAPLLGFAFSGWFKRGAAVWIVPLVCGLAVSGSIEFLQQWILFRVPCWSDVVYNVLGTLGGIILLALVLKWRVDSRIVEGI